MMLKDMPIGGKAKVLTDEFYSGHRINEVIRLDKRSWVGYTDRGSFSYLPGLTAYAFTPYEEMTHGPLGYAEVELTDVRPPDNMEA